MRKSPTAPKHPEMHFAFCEISIFEGLRKNHEHSKAKGFNYPLTPKGKSTLNPPPPWYYSSDFLDVEF
jgi:hypothetical protein